MTRRAILAHGLTPVASVMIEDNEFKIQVTNPSVAAINKAIYAFVIDDEIVRIGASKGPLSGRLRAWERGVTRRLEGKNSPTPEKEAAEWRRRLPPGVQGEVLARKGAEVTTQAGTFNAYLSEESHLIGTYLPPLNWSKHR